MGQIKIILTVFVLINLSLHSSLLYAGGGPEIEMTELKKPQNKAPLAQPRELNKQNTGNYIWTQEKEDRLNKVLGEHGLLFY